MDEHPLLEQVRSLRADGCSPKVIARILGMSKAEVVPLVRAVAREREAELTGVVPSACWVSRGWSVGLTVDTSRGWPDPPLSAGERCGLVGVLVARRDGGATGPASVCGYLIDPYCLGVKNALGPRPMSRHQLARFVDRFFEVFDGVIEAPLDLARHLVWGSVAYAHGLGFEPHPDFLPAAGHVEPLGDEEAAAIGFGRDGKPFYVQGPYDDAEFVLSTLAGVS